MTCDRPVRHREGTKGDMLIPDAIYAKSVTRHVIKTYAEQHVNRSV